MGFTLTEIAIVLGVVGLVLGALWVVTVKVNEGQKQNSAVNELQVVVQNLLSTRQGQPFPAAVDITAQLIQQSVIPMTYVIQPVAAVPPQAVNPWQGAGSFVVTATGTVAPFRSFNVQFTGVSRAGCQMLLLRGTLCTPGTQGCPTSVYAASAVTAADICTTGSGAVAGTCLGAPEAAALGWRYMNPTIAQALCALNPNPSASVVGFNYSL